MPTAYTSLLGLALPVTGELQGTWGTTVNDAITSLLDTAVAGTTTLNTDADVTLTTTTGASNQARQAIILWTANGTVTRNITAPAQSKTYVVINNSAGTQSIVIRGAGPTTGVTVLKGERVTVAWNGSDFVKVGGFGGSGTFNDVTITTGNLSFTGTAQRITGDMSNATAANRLMFQTSTVNGATGVAAIPNGTGTFSAFECVDNSDIANGALGYIGISGGSDVRIVATRRGTGSFLPIVLYTGGSERMRIDTSGNVGVGTSSPANKLVVSNAGAAGFEFDPASGIFQLYNRSTSAYASLRLYGSELRFFTGSSPTETMRLDTSGNLGLGVTPSAWGGSVATGNLQLAASALYTFGTSGGGVVTNAFYNSSNQWVYRNSTLAALYQQSSGGHAWFTAPSGTAGNTISFTQAMTLDASGNLGIGTSSPGSKLHVNGNIQNAAGQWIGNSAGASYLADDGVTGGSIRNGGSFFITTGGTERMRIDASGNVGIGTASPSGFSAKLVSASTTNQLALTTADTRKVALFNYSVDTFNIGVEDGYGVAAIAFRNNGSERMRIDSSGNVGIGTASPYSQLDVWSSIVSPTLGEATGVGSIRITNGASALSSAGGIEFKNAGDSNGFGAKIQALNSGGSQLVFANRFGSATWVERMRIDSSGNVGIGTASPTFRFVSANNITDGGWIYSSGAVSVLGLGGYANAGDGAFQIRYDRSSGFTTLNGGSRDTPAARVTIDNTGNVGIGTASPAVRLQATNTSGEVFRLTNTTATERLHFYTRNAAGTSRVESQNSDLQLFAADPNLVTFGTSNVERARITSGGDLLVGSTTLTNIAGRAQRLHVTQTGSGVWAGGFVNTATAGNNPYGVSVFYSGSSPNGTANAFFWAEDNAALRAEIRSNGGLANYQANDVNLSDRREKTNFAPAKDYLDTICAIPVQTFNYIDQSPDDPGLTLGVVAQDVQAVAPELVHESNWGTEDNPKMRLSVYQTDLQYALMKCIQEQQALITALTARVAALEAA